MAHPDPTRRTFLQASGGAFFSMAAMGFAVPTQRLAFGKDDEIRVAVAGIRSRGVAHIEGLRKLPNVRVVALCDVDSGFLGREVAKFEKRGEKVDGYRDFRELIKREDLHVVSLATPNHWHALQTVWACKAGLDVYVEKPVCHSLGEGLRMVAAARDYKRIVQVGTQSRSSYAIRDAITWLHEGHLGEIKLARGFCYKPRKSIGKVSGPQEIPRNVDYDLWTGPAPMRALERKQLHYDWHWDSTTGNGDLGNQGVHQVDICRWALQEPGLPTEILSVGGRLGYDDDGNTPNTQIIWSQFASAAMLFEVRGLPRDIKAQKEDWGGGMDRYQGVKVGVVIDCEKGSLRIPDYSSAEALDLDGKSVKKWNGAKNHFANFITAVRSGNPADLNAEIVEGHLSAAPCHLANLSHQLGRTASAAQITAALGANPAMSEAFQRMTAHLLANDVDLEATPLTLGRALLAGNTTLSQAMEADPSTKPWLFRDGRGEFRFPS